MRHRLAAPLLALAGLAAAWTAGAEDAVPIITREARTDVALTIYDQDLALVKDTRDVPLPAGESTIRFEDVAAKIDPRTVTVYSIGAPEGLAVVEQRYAFDLLSPEQLLQKYVGKEVELVETDARLRTRTTKATLLSTKGGPVYQVGSRLAVGHPGRVLLPEPADGFYARPTLLWRLANGGPARHRLEVSYLTGGLSWGADYVAVLNAEGTKADLTGWATLTNQSGARYDGATVKLIAGHVNRARGREALLAAEMAERKAAVPRFTEEALFEYHLYTLDQRTSLAEDETKQLRLLAARDVGVKKSLVLVGQPGWFRSRQGDLGRDLPVGVFLEVRNDAPNNLGMPLPAGTVRVYQLDKVGAEQFLGEDAIPHTPKDEKVALRVGQASDVVATRTQTEYRKLDAEPFDAEVAFAITLRNRKSEPVTVLVREPLGGVWKVVQASHTPAKLDAGTLGFEVAVPAAGETALSYRVQVGF